MDVWLVQHSEYERREIPVVEKDFVIGREPTCQLRLDHGRVSHRHTRLFRFGSVLMAEDLNSTFGTAVNGQDLGPEPVELRDGDDLRVGSVHFQVVVGRRPAEAAPAVAEPATVAANRPSDSNITSPAMASARQILDRIAAAHESQDAERAARHQAAAKGRKTSVVEEQGVSVVRIVEKSVVEEQEIRRISDELDQLVGAGKTRIALNFGAVEHLSSQALGTVLRLHQRCRADGGMLKICKVNPKVAEIFAMTNIQKHIEIYTDEQPALDSTWPAARPSEAAPPAGPAAPPPQSPSSPGPSQPPPTGAPRVRLIVGVGKAIGQAIEVRTAKFVIGRDPRCQLRPNSETISRVHAIIELHEGRVVVRDAGTKNGTIVDGRALHGEEVEVADGAQFQVGVLQFTMKIDAKPALAAGAAPPAEPGSPDDELAALLLGHGSADSESPTAFLIPTQPVSTATEPPSTPRPTPPPPTAPALAPPPAGPLRAASLACEVIEGVTVIRVQATELDEERTVGPFRHDLHALFDYGLPRRVVVDMSGVNYLSSRAVGVILACYQRLDREGGAMRLCRVSPRLVPVLDQMRLPKLIDVMETADEAIRTPWI